MLATQSSLSIVAAALSSLSSGAVAQTATKAQLETVLGHFPEPPPLQMVVLETVAVEGGTRELIEYVAEQEDPLFNRLLTDQAG